MQPISFPNLHLTFEINPVAIGLGIFQIYWYGILIALAFLVGIFICKKQNGLFQIKYEDISDYLLIAVFVGILCARLYFILFHLDYYGKNPIEILKVYHRGTGDLWWVNRGNNRGNCLL